MLYYVYMHNAPAAAAAAAIATLGTLHANGYVINRATAYNMRSRARLTAYNGRKLRQFARTYYANVAIAKVVAHSMAQFKAAQRYGLNW